MNTTLPITKSTRKRHILSIAYIFAAKEPQQSTQLRAEATTLSQPAIIFLGTI